MAIKSIVFVDVVTKTDKSQKSLLKYAAVVGIAALAIKGMISVGKKLIEVYKVQEQAEAKFIGALRATGTEATVSAKNFFALASSLQQVTLYGDEATIEATALLQSLAKLSDKGLKKLVPLIQDFATGMRVDLNAAMSLVGKTLGSSTNALTRYGIEVDMTGTKEEKLISLTKSLEEKFGGMAKAVADTATGAMTQLSNAFGDLKEEAGESLAKGIKPVVTWLTKVMEKASASAKEIKAINEALKSIGAEEGDTLDELYAKRKIYTQAITDLGEEELKKLIKVTDQFLRSENYRLKKSDEIRYAYSLERTIINNKIHSVETEIKVLESLATIEADLKREKEEAALIADKASEKEAAAAKELLTWLDKVQDAFDETKEGRIAAVQASITWFETEQKLAVKTAHMFEPILAMLHEQKRLLEEVPESKVKALIIKERDLRLAGLQKQVNDYRDMTDQFNFLRLDDEAKEIESLQKLADEFIAAGLKKIEVTKWVEKEIAEIKRVYVDKEKQETADKIKFYLEQWQIFSEATGKFLVEASKGWDILKKAAQDVIANILKMLGTEASVKATTALIALQFGEAAKQAGIAGLYFAGAGAVQAFEKGGVIDEPIFGVGKSGQKYSFGESGPEEVRPIGQASRGVVFDVHGNTFVGTGGLREFAIEMRREFDSITVLGL